MLPDALRLFRYHAGQTPRPAAPTAPAPVLRATGFGYDVAQFEPRGAG